MASFPNPGSVSGSYIAFEFQVSLVLINLKQFTSFLKIFLDIDVFEESGPVVLQNVILAWIGLSLNVLVELYK